MRGEKGGRGRGVQPLSGITPACAGKRGRGDRDRARAEDHPRMRGEKVNTNVATNPGQGSHPHARGKDTYATDLQTAGGITPACAGKSRTGSTHDRCGRDHPRMRGEKTPRQICSETGRGSPPHARGKAHRQARCQNDAGITPACAGKRSEARLRSAPPGDHPRMRGEKLSFVVIIESRQGSPPHARGKGQH